MKQIKLLKNHVDKGIEYAAGETIEVSDEDYKWLMEIYLAERKDLVKSLEKADKKLRGENA